LGREPATSARPPTLASGETSAETKRILMCPFADGSMDGYSQPMDAHVPLWF
jgi:hypothetical protein